MTFFIKQLCFLLTITIWLFSCSGGGLDSETNEPRPSVIVNAGADKSVDENTTVTLSADAVGQTAVLIYSWRVSPNLSILQGSANEAFATFVAPTTTKTVEYTFTLEVSDEAGNKGSDTVIYTILPMNLSPTALIEASQFSGMPTNQYPAGVQVILAGNESFDPDENGINQAVVQYQWQQTSGAEVLEGISTDGDSLAFITPVLETSNSLSFSLTVTDAEGAQSSQTITLNVQSASDTLPIVNAGLDHQVLSGESIILNGLASTSVEAAKPLTYRWLTDSELKPTIDDINQLATFAVAPKVTSSQTMTFSLEVKDAAGNIVLDSINVNVRPMLIRPLNDTGVIQQATLNQNLSIHQSDYPGQDGQRGQDIIAANGLLEKAGQGEQGFDFTRLDAVGDEVDDTALAWSCVRDNVSGLIWEVKQPAASSNLHSSSHTYTWYLAEQEGDPTGTQSSSLTQCSLTECNTSAYVEAVNAEGLCNFHDWRIPSHQELLSIVHFGRNEAPMVDPVYFPNTTESLGDPVWYWVNQSSADGTPDELSRTAWALDFASGNDNFLLKSTPSHIRLVRAGR